MANTSSLKNSNLPQLELDRSEKLIQLPVEPSRRDISSSKAKQERVIRIVYEKTANNAVKKEIIIRNYQGWLIILLALIIAGICYIVNM